MDDYSAHALQQLATSQLVPDKIRLLRLSQYKILPLFNLKYYDLDEIATRIETSHQSQRPISLAKFQQIFILIRSLQQRYFSYLSQLYLRVRLNWPQVNNRREPQPLVDCRLNPGAEVGGLGGIIQLAKRMTTALYYVCVVGQRFRACNQSITNLIKTENVAKNVELRCCANQEAITALALLLEFSSTRGISGSLTLVSFIEIIA